MKFSYKILLCTIIMMAVAFGFSGYYFMHYLFQASMEREITQAMDESSILQFAFETAALNIPSKYDVLSDAAVEQIASKLESGGGERNWLHRRLRLSDENGNILYASNGFVADTGFLGEISEGNRSYQIIEDGGHYYIQTGIVLQARDRKLLLETMQDVTTVFMERTRGFSVYRRVTLLVLVVSSLLMLGFSHWLTKPIRLLEKATRQMARGAYDYRARQVSGDELGELTRDFNKMAKALEKNMHMLRNEVRAREDFIAAFSHELKTPLTSIIGYADMLRSKKMPEEQHFLAANYIYTESRRLETMSFRLLDIIVTGKEKARRKMTDSSYYFRYLSDMFEGNEEFCFRIGYDEAQVYADPDLLISVLINLIDNACKASEPGNVIEINGTKEEEGYRFQVRDYGVGIPEEECEKITEAFYMVDKSRSRSKNGAGLGLALCKAILKLHGSRLEIESRPGEGSRFHFCIKPGKEADDETQRL